jgi:hypothetical protein
MNAEDANNVYWQYSGSLWYLMEDARARPLGSMSPATGKVWLSKSESFTILPSELTLTEAKEIAKVIIMANRSTT